MGYISVLSNSNSKTFISRARIVDKCHNVARWRLWQSKQMSLHLPLKHVPWQTALTQWWWQTVPHCGTVEDEAALVHRRLYSWQVDTSSRCRPQSRMSFNILDRHAEFLQIWTGGVTLSMHFHTRTVVLKMILLCRLRFVALGVPVFSLSASQSMKPVKITASAILSSSRLKTNLLHKSFPPHTASFSPNRLHRILPVFRFRYVQQFPVLFELIT